MNKIKILLISIFSVLVFVSNAYAKTNIEFTTCSDNNKIIEFMFIDAMGNKTGYDGQTKQIIKDNYPNMQYGGSGSSDPDSGDVNLCSKVIGSVPTPSYLQPFKIIVSGLQLNKYEIDFTTGESTDYNWRAKYLYSNIKGWIDIGQQHTYEIMYTPYQPVQITRIATSTDLIADITTAQKLNLIGSSEFVSEITRKINKIEEKRLKPAQKDKDDDKNGLTPAQKAKKEYQELLNEITEKYNKPESDEFVKQEAYTVLREDLEYIIGHIQ